jgi:hypothetical protein
MCSQGRRRLEQHFGVSIAFQNCHRVAAFPFDTCTTEPYREFVSSRAQVRNENPELVNC